MTVLLTIRDCAAAADGGALAFQGEDADGATSWYVVNRSIASRGTPDFNAISKNGVRLSDDERAELFRMLTVIEQDADNDRAAFMDRFMA